MNSTEAGSLNFAAIVVLALTITGSDISADRSDAGGSTFIKLDVVFSGGLPMYHNNFYIWLGLMWMAFLMVGIAYVLFSQGATWL